MLWPIVRPSLCVVRAMVCEPLTPLKVPPTVSACHSGAMVTLTTVAAVGTFFTTTLWMSIVFLVMPSVTVFVPPSVSVAVACAVIRSPWL